MNAPGPSQFPVAQAGWLIALLFVGWLAFLFVPSPKPAPEPAAAFVKPPPSRLVALGLPDNPDLDALPEIFAMFADKAEWTNDKTLFAYWNPGSKSYSYFFEATRTGATYHFRSIKLETEPSASEAAEEGLDADYYWGEIVTENCPVRLIYSVYWFLNEAWTRRNRWPRAHDPAIIKGDRRMPNITPMLSPAPIKIPPPELKIPQLDLGKKS